MQGKHISLSRPRRFLIDLLHHAAKIPTVPVQRELKLADVVAARAFAANRPGWPAVFIKSYSLVADEVPQLRRAYLGLPWAHLREYSENVACIAVEREYCGEPCVFFGRIRNPSQLALSEIQSRIREFAEAPLDKLRAFGQMLSLAGWPRPVRRMLLWLGLNLPHTRFRRFGTFGLSVYSSLGAESLHPLSPLTTTLNYGVIGADGSVGVRLVYDHRVFDGATAARALGKLEDVMRGPILDELRNMSAKHQSAA